MASCRLAGNLRGRAASKERLGPAPGSPASRLSSHLLICHRFSVHIWGTDCSHVSQRSIRTILNRDLLTENDRKYVLGRQFYFLGLCIGSEAPIVSKFYSKANLMPPLVV